jgi:hypothetical protein
VAIITFALQDSDLPLQLAWPILMANLAEWYRPQRPVYNVVDSLTPGAPVTIRPMVEADEVVIRRPDGSQAMLSLEQSAEVIFVDTAQLGLYQVEVRQDGRTVQRDAFAVNLFEPAESAIAPAGELLLKTDEGQAVVSANRRSEIGRRELWTYLAGIGLLILGLEWWYYHRSLRRKIRLAGGVILQRRASHSASRPRWKVWASRAR